MGKQFSTVQISAIGTTLTALIYFGPPLARGGWTRFAKYNRWMGFASICLASLSLLVASFCKDIVALVVFMGVIPGIGCGLATVNYMIWLPTWFFSKRSFANGVAFSGAGTGGLFVPFLLNAVLQKGGFGWALRSWAALLFLLGSTACLLVKPRFPLESSEKNGSRPRRARTWKSYFSGIAYLFSPLWITNALATFAASLAFFAVSFFLATYCTSLGLSATAATGAVAAFNGASLVGEITIGHACDRFSYPAIMAMIGVVASLSSLLLFGLVQSLGGVLGFVLLFAWSTGSFCALWTPGAFDIARLRSMQTATVILSFAFVRGVASLVGPLLAAALYKPEQNQHRAIFGSFGFDALIAFVGAMMASVCFCAAGVGFFRRLSFKSKDFSELQERF